MPSGGHAHAKKPRNYYFPLLRKVRKLGLKTALSLKFAQGKLKIVRSTHVDEAKTKNLARVVEGKVRTHNPPHQGMVVATLMVLMS